MNVTDDHPLIWLPDLPVPGDLDRLLGAKTAGLFLLPPGWTLPYVVLTTALHERWLAGELSPGWLRPEMTFLGMDNAIAAVFSGNQIIVRSSGIRETMEERGRMTSSLCEPDLAQVEKVVENSWSASRSADPGTPMALIVQQWKAPRLLGHLSNERRVSARHDSWLVESLTPEGVLTSSQRVAPRRPVSDDLLIARTSVDLTIQLRRVAGRHLSRMGRRHFEWTWDGRRLWVVQCDFEKTVRGRPPGSAWEQRIGEAASVLTVFVKAVDASGPWQKAECIRVFAERGLPTADLYILEDAVAVEELSLGRVSPAVRHDVLRLTRLPVIVRSDTAPGALGGIDVLLPRTETCTTPDQVIDFLLATSARFVDLGLGPGDFCFLVHHFIPARSGSYSIAAPGRQRVRVDSIWGVPDGLLYMAHDSFEVDADGEEVWRKIRCKASYIDFASDGTWFEKAAGTDWDWRPSITNTELASVASQARSIADHMGLPVEVMHFIGVDPSSGLPDVLPWYFRPTELPSYELATAPRFGWQSYLVRSPQDLVDLENVLRRAPGSIASIQLRALTAYTHDQEFVRSVAHMAQTHDLPVDLEGSVLAHTFYMLRRSGVRVRPVDLEHAREATGARLFEKLVRDQVPSMIEGGGEHAVIRHARSDELIALLRQKAVEEALELYKAVSDDDLVAEAADLIEVVRAVAMALGRSLGDILLRADDKRMQRGGFEAGLVLKGTYVRPLSSLHRAEQLFEIEVDPTADHHAEASIVLEPEGKALRLRVNPVPPVHLPVYSKAEMPGQGFAIEARRDVDGIHLSIEPLPVEINPDQPSLFDPDA